MVFWCFCLICLLFLVSVCLVFFGFTLYVSLSSHTHLFHTLGISMRSMCTGACHACTTSHCDLRDPGWGDPGSRHCDFFAWHLSAHPVIFCCPSVVSMNGLLGTRHISCMMPSFHRFVVLLWVCLVSVCWLFLCFGFLLLWWCFLVCFGWCLLLIFLCGMTSHGLAPRIQEACHSIGFTCSISTASKHLHNDPARAIKALEQKKVGVFWFVCGWSFLPFYSRGTASCFALHHRHDSDKECNNLQEFSSLHFLDWGNFASPAGRELRN